MKRANAQPRHTFVAQKSQQVLRSLPTQVSSCARQTTDLGANQAEAPPATVHEAASELVLAACDLFLSRLDAKCNFKAYQIEHNASHVIRQFHMRQLSRRASRNQVKRGSKHDHS